MKKIFIILGILVTFTACKTKMTNSSPEEASTEVAKEVQWSSLTLAEARSQAIEMGKPLFIDVSAEWCGYCKKMKKKVYTDEQVGLLLNKGYIPMTLDGEKGDGVAMMSKYDIKGFPTQLILGTDGTLLKKNFGYLEVDQLLNFLK